MHIPFAGRALFVVVLSTTTACAATTEPPPCTMIGASSIIQISQDLVPSKGGSSETCVNSTCESAELRASTPDQKELISLTNPTDAQEATITLKIIAEGKTTFDERTTVKPEEVYLNGPNCGSEFVFRMTADQTGLHPTP